MNAESKAWIWKGSGQLRISQYTPYEELYLLCSNQEQERYKDLPNCVTAVRVALINYSPQQILEISASPNIRAYEFKKYVSKKV